MAVKRIRLIGDPVLRKKSKPVKKSEKRLVKKLVKDLKDTLLDFRERKKYGRGIAAPQLGVLKRVIFIRFKGRDYAIINPRIVKKSKRKFKLWDSCFSFDIAFFVRVERHWSVTVQYLDENFEKKELKASGDLSELLQHEIDHLSGVLATDRMVSRKGIISLQEYKKRFAN